eukprot:2239976-Pleurochrysis_carterae.AAC.1
MSDSESLCRPTVTLKAKAPMQCAAAATETHARGGGVNEEKRGWTMAANAGRANPMGGAMGGERGLQQGKASCGSGSEQVCLGLGSGQKGDER